MGCCASSPKTEEGLEQVVVVPRDVSCTGKWLSQGERAMDSGCQVLAYTAACPASYPFETLTRVVGTPAYTFAALFDGCGGCQAVQFCLQRCHEVYARCLEGSDTPERALRRTVAALDEAFFASDLPDMVKASVGATALLAHVDHATGCCHVARLGDGQPVLGRARGAFADTVVEARPLASAHSHRSTLAAIAQRHADAQRRGCGAPDQGAAPCGDGRVGDLGGGQAHEGPPSRGVYTRCIGLGVGKHRHMAAAWAKANPGEEPLPEAPFCSADCEVTMHVLGPGDECLVLASEGALALVSPQEASMLCHHFAGGTLRRLHQAYLAAQGAAGGGGAGQAAPASEDSLAPQQQPRESGEANPAALLMRRAQRKALSRLEAARGRALTLDQLQALDLQVDLAACQAAAQRPAAQGRGRGGGGEPQQAAAPVRLVLPRDWAARQRAAGLAKGDVHSDMAALVLCFEWPGTSGRPLTSTPLKAAAGAGGQANTPPRAPAAGSAAARYRWQLLRLEAKFAAARRRQLLQAWWAAAEGVAHRADQLARETEVAAWRLLGEAVHVSRTGGVVEEADAVRPHTRGAGDVPARHVLPTSRPAGCGRPPVTPPKAVPPHASSSGSAAAKGRSPARPAAASTPRGGGATRVPLPGASPGGGTPKGAATPGAPGSKQAAPGGRASTASGCATPRASPAGPPAGARPHSELSLRRRRSVEPA